MLLKVLQLHFEVRLSSRVEQRVDRERFRPGLLLGEELALSGLGLAEAVLLFVVVGLHSLVV